MKASRNYKKASHYKSMQEKRHNKKCHPAAEILIAKE